MKNLAIIDLKEVVWGGGRLVYEKSEAGFIDFYVKRRFRYLFGYGAGTGLFTLLPFGAVSLARPF